MAVGIVEFCSKWLSRLLFSPVHIILDYMLGAGRKCPYAILWAGKIPQYLPTRQDGCDLVELSELLVSDCPGFKS